MFSEVVDLLVSVKIARLKQHLLRDARVHILVHHLNPRIELLGVDLFVANLAVLHDLLLGLVLLLEVALGLQVPIRAHSLETVTLRDKARRVRPSLMVQEGVRVRGLRSESRRRHKLFKVGKQKRSVRLANVLFYLLASISGWKVSLTL